MDREFLRPHESSLNLELRGEPGIRALYSEGFHIAKDAEEEEFWPGLGQVLLWGSGVGKEANSGKD